MEEDNTYLKKVNTYIDSQFDKNFNFKHNYFYLTLLFFIASSICGMVIATWNHGVNTVGYTFGIVALIVIFLNTVYIFSQFKGTVLQMVGLVLLFILIEYILEEAILPGFMFIPAIIWQILFFGFIALIVIAIKQIGIKPYLITMLSGLWFLLKVFAIFTIFGLFMGLFSSTSSENELYDKYGNRVK